MVAKIELISKFLLIVSGISVTFAWLIPTLKLKLSAKELAKLTISTIADGKFSRLYKMFLLLSATSLAGYIFISYPNIATKLVACLLLLSAISFIFITLKTSFSLHIASAFIFYFGLSCFCAIYTGSVFRLLPLILFVIMLIQTIILKRGNGLSTLLLVYSTWAVLILS